MASILASEFASQQLTVYVGLTIFITGIIGGLLNLIIFTTLKSFRQTTCAFFLLITSIVNVIQLLTITLIFILTNGFYIYSTSTSWFCKVHTFLIQWGRFTALSSICLATIDQFLSMSKYRHWSNLRLARRSIIIACLIGFVHCIFTLIYFDSFHGICIIINPTFAKYVSLFQVPVLFGCLPIIIMVSFSVFTFVCARRLASRRQVNIVRLRRDHQLTAMVLVHVVFYVLTTSPYFIFNTYLINQNSTNPEQIAYNNLIATITGLLASSSTAGSFYIYCCVSKRFRKQLVYVMINIWMKRWRQWMNKPNHNAIVPSSDLALARRPTAQGQVCVETISLHQMKT